MKSRRIHRIIGLMLVLPMLAWTVTGLIFFIKPGYTQAYEPLVVKTYPLETAFMVPSSMKWQEVRLIKTILGPHLLVKTDGSMAQLDPVSLQPKEMLSKQQYKSLLEDAFLNNRQRYGNVVSIDGQHAKTTTGVEINLDWNNLSLTQTGQDTKRINLFYKIHYLQWTPLKGINQLLGILGLLLLLSLTVLGVKIYITGRK